MFELFEDKMNKIRSHIQYPPNMYYIDVSGFHCFIFVFYLDPRVSGSRAADPRVAASRIPDPSISDRRDPRIPEPRSSDPRASDPRANSGGHTNGPSWRGNADAPRPRPSIPADGPGTYFRLCCIYSQTLIFL